MYKEQQIYCQHCGQPSGYTQEGLMYYLITYDLCCQKCGKVVIRANRATCTSGWVTEFYKDPCNPENNWVAQYLNQCDTFVRTGV